MHGTSMPTLDTVAALAGVSRQTVSNALHRPDRLRPQTRDRVLAAIAELGYRPSGPARQLATRRSMGVAVPAHRPQPDTVSGFLLDAFLHGLADACLPSGHRVLLYPAAADDRDEIHLIEDMLLTGSADAVVLTASHARDERADWLRARRTPFVSFGRPWSTSSGEPGGENTLHDWVDVDGAAGCAQAVEYLAALGCREIAFLGWPVGSEVGDDRRRGWFEAARRLGVLSGVGALESEERSGAAHAVMSAALRGPRPPDGLVCASDTLALGAWQAAGGRRPLQIVGFDATPVTSALGLASVAQPVAQVARACMELMLPRLAGDEPPARGVLLQPRLITPTGPPDRPDHPADDAPPDVPISRPAARPGQSQGVELSNE